MTSISSDELNFLVFRYLQESGLTHSAFTLGYEAGINKYPVDGSLVPPGALITFIQKGLQYLEMEANLSNSDTDMDEDFAFLQPLDLITKDVNELRRMISEKKKNMHKDRDKNRDFDRKCEDVRGRVRLKERKEREKQIEKKSEKGSKEREKEREREKVMIQKKKEHEKEHGEDHAGKEVGTDKNDKVNMKQEETGFSVDPEPMDISTGSMSQTCEIPSSDVTILEGHIAEVCACVWCPTGSLLASGSGDSTARIWTVADGTSRSSSQNSPTNVVVLKHVKGRTISYEKNKDVTTLDWNVEGTLLATGSYDGHARLWNTDGELRSTLSKHKGPIFSLKWNKKGDYLLTGSCDTTAIVWDAKAEAIKHVFEYHKGPILDVDWRNNSTFASSSTDTMIYVCKIGENKPINTFAGHQGEVNCVKWDPTGLLLASCSDDSTAKIWSVKQEKYVHNLTEHSKEIYTLRWSPTGPGTINPNQQLILASASFDSTVKLWEVEYGRLLCSLKAHREPVYSVAFSPNGQYLASGSLDKSVHIWSLKDSKIVKTYTGNGGIFEVCWNKEGNRIAACSADNTLCVLEFRM